jgi:hypothetical protein
LIALDRELHEELSLGVGLTSIVGGGDLAKHQLNTHSFKGADSH